MDSEQAQETPSVTPQDMNLQQNQFTNTAQARMNEQLSADDKNVFDKNWAIALHRASQRCGDPTLVQRFNPC